MSKFTASGYKKSLSYAIEGLSVAYKTQRNYRFHLLAGFIAILGGILLNFKCIEYCVLILSISFVITAELFNSVIEFALDALYKNKYSKLVKLAKDLSAGVVLIAAMTSILIGLMLFGRKLLIMFLY
ncbi:MAG: diacylglycerol kinase family protein [Clostridium sp.]|nr:diacylglycerol kinase family protein [Clostridium sp.]